MRKKNIFAPIFNHGEGIGFTGHHSDFCYLEKVDCFNLMLNFFSQNKFSIEHLKLSEDFVEIYQNSKVFKLFEKKHLLNQKTEKIPKVISFKNLYYPKKKTKLWYSGNNFLNILSPYKSIPFFLDFYCEEINFVIKYITRIDCYIYDENCADGNANFNYNCKSTAIKLRDFLIKKNLYNVAVFYDPVVRYDVLNDDYQVAKQRSEKLIEAQVQDFFKWLKENNII